MSNEIEIIGDGDGFAFLGDATDVERFLRDQGLDQVPSKKLDLNRLKSSAAIGLDVANKITENSGRWVKLTPESAKAVKEFGLMATKTSGVSHAMIGQPGHIKEWIQIAKGPAMLLSGPTAITALSTMMQQQAMQAQMEEMLEYLKAIDEKVDDILRNQKDAVLADMIGVDLIIEEAFTVREQTGRVSETTWSKVQATSMTIARTQAYAVRQLDGIAGKLERTTDAGEMAKAAKGAESKVREWLAVLARCLLLQDGISVLELDRVFDSEPEELEKHRLGLAAARQKRVELLAQSTSCLLTQMTETVRKANSKVLFNPLKSPATVRSSKRVSEDVHEFRGRLGLDSDQEDCEAKRWSQAATETRDQVVSATVEGVNAAYHLGAETVDHAAAAFRPVDADGGGAGKAPVLTAAEEAGTAIKGAAADAAGAVSAGAKTAGAAVGGLVTGAADAAGSLFRRKKDAAAPEEPPEATDEVTQARDA